MKIVVMDGQGGRMGAAIVEGIVKSGLGAQVHAVGTNSAATTAMLRSGAATGATGENPVIVACRDADVIVGPIGIISADSLYGEVTPAMAVAVGQSAALKLLLPVNGCNNEIVGAGQLSMTDMVRQTVERLRELTERG